jgi:para-aminobenzoate synthetase component 1
MLQPAYFEIDFTQVKDRVKQFAHRFDTYAFFESHESPVPTTGRRYAFIAMMGAGDELVCHANALERIRPFINGHRSQHNWVFCALSYDLKNELELLESTGEEQVVFPVAHCFVPEIVVSVDETGMICIHSNKHEPERVLDTIKQTDPIIDKPSIGFRVTKKISHANYRLAFENLMRHIQRGDTYEITYCQQTEVSFEECDPMTLYNRFANVSPNPFSVVFKTRDRAVVCASPERFLQCDHDRLLSQPMKGTARRSAEAAADKKLKTDLANSKKERSENVMIVDLVRNDLSKVARKGSVRVDELFGVYSFPKSHQMISTISCQMKPGMDFNDIIQATFPMGSMTGAPKVSSMKIIDQVEDFKRGMFSGTIGFMAPGCYFDLNVVIRSILLDLKNKKGALTAGGAITCASDVESEWQECLTKLKPQLEAVGLKAEDVIALAPTTDETD